MPGYLIRTLPVSWALIDFSVPVQPPLGFPSSYPQPRTPFQSPKTISPCPSDMAAGLFSSSPQWCLAQPWALLSQARLHTHVLAQLQHVPVPRAASIPYLYLPDPLGTEPVVLKTHKDIFISNPTCMHLNFSDMSLPGV